MSFISLGVASSFLNNGGANYKDLSFFIYSINQMLYDYSIGNFSVVAEMLTLETYNTMSLNLENIKKDPVMYPDYENIRKSVGLSLQGLFHAVRQYSLLANAEYELNILQENELILNDVSKLNTRLNELLSAHTILPSSTVSIIRAELKPEYAEYIALYGWPEGGIFEMDKLAVAILNVS
jgi:hypothetical protein